jgi:hypothetical protein
MIPRAFFSLVLGALCCAGAGGAAAHAFLDRASPAVGSTVHTAPTEVRIQYTEELEPDYSSAHVEDAAGATVSTAAHVDENERSVLIVPLGTLKPGRYKVIWKVLSVDTHVTNGTFTFTVAP